jgi:hypothetical protein
MKRIFLLLTLGLVVLVVVWRQRIFLWDPLASVERGGAKQAPVRVMINYSNDVLMDDASTGQHVFYLVEHWNQQPSYAVAAIQGCVRYLACWMDADQVQGEAFRPAHGVAQRVSMTDKRVEFVDGSGAMVEVTLR